MSKLKKNVEKDSKDIIKEHGKIAKELYDDNDGKKNINIEKVGNEDNSSFNIFEKGSKIITKGNDKKYTNEITNNDFSLFHPPPNNQENDLLKTKVYTNDSPFNYNKQTIKNNPFRQNSKKKNDFPLDNKIDNDSIQLEFPKDDEEVKFAINKKDQKSLKKIII